MLLVFAAAVVRHLVALAAGGFPGCLLMMLTLLMCSALAHLWPLYLWVQGMLQAPDPAHVPAIRPHIPTVTPCSHLGKANTDC
jgi:hypothetical protein